ncbi:MAG: hypothetical protein N3F05_04400 [Candidatus Diapherotrites archaeon]|nr:hypothetical protein [Candidatus Diapherotrites archaeon]
MDKTEFTTYHVIQHIDLSSIPRRKRRFFRNKNRIITAVSKHIANMPDVREAEKQRIIQELREKLEHLAKEELILLSERIFDQMSKEEAEKIVEKSIREKRKGTEQLTKADIEEIVNSIYEHIKESKRNEVIEKQKEETNKEKELKKVKERLSSLKKEPEKEVMQPKQRIQESKNIPSDDEILAELKKSSFDDELSESDLSLGDKEKDESLFRELEELTSEEKKKKK